MHNQIVCIEKVLDNGLGHICIQVAIVILIHYYEYEMRTILYRQLLLSIHFFSLVLGNLIQYREAPVADVYQRLFCALRMLTYHVYT